MIVFRWILSVVFIVQMYLAMAVLALVFAPFALFSRGAALMACHAYCAWVIFTARLLCGIKSDVRGTPPKDEVVIAAKHQSFFDIILIFHAVPRARFIMKRELMFVPFLGQYALRIGCIPVDRGKRGAAITKMKADVAKGSGFPGQLIIYPQGTRVAPGAKLPYKIGTGLIYDQLGQPCVPVATNVGVLWPKRSLLRTPGTAVVEFMEPIPPGKPVSAFMRQLEEMIEPASDRLMAEAGFRPG